MRGFTRMRKPLAGVAAVGSLVLFAAAGLMLAFGVSGEETYDHVDDGHDDRRLHAERFGPSELRFGRRHPERQCLRSRQWPAGPAVRGVDRLIRRQRTDAIPVQSGCRQHPARNASAPRLRDRRARHDHRRHPDQAGDIRLHHPGHRRSRRHRDRTVQPHDRLARTPRRFRRFHARLSGGRAASEGRRPPSCWDRRPSAKLKAPPSRSRRSQVFGTRGIPLAADLRCACRAGCRSWRRRRSRVARTPRRRGTRGGIRG